MKLLAKSKHKIKKGKSEVIGITRDGWTITENGTYGDVHVDCEIELDMTGYLKEFRTTQGLSQQEMAWILGVARTTYILYEKGRQEISLREFMMIAAYVPDSNFKQMQKDFLATPYQK